MFSLWGVVSAAFNCQETCLFLLQIVLHIWSLKTLRILHRKFLLATLLIKFNRLSAPHTVHYDMVGAYMALI